MRRARSGGGRNGGRVAAARTTQLAALSGAWHGRGASASREFLMRHADAAAAAAAAVRTAAEALAALRDNLWQIVDGKVAAAMAIDDRRLTERADWLAAAQTVTTGAGDRAAASELIDQEVKPFVDNDIRSDWLTAMRTTTASVTASYDAATAGLATDPAAVFEVPGELGPAWSPPSSSEARVPDEPVRSAGGVASHPAAVVSAPPAASSAPPPPWPRLPSGRHLQCRHLRCRHLRCRHLRRCPNPLPPRPPWRRRLPCRHSANWAADCPAPQVVSPGWDSSLSMHSAAC